MNELTPAQLELLTVLSEECGEVIQAVSKVIRHGYYSSNPLLIDGPKNYQVLAKEMGHVRAAMIRLCAQGPISKIMIHEAADVKLRTGDRWLYRQDSNGIPRYDLIGYVTGVSSAITEKPVNESSRPVYLRHD